METLHFGIYIAKNDIFNAQEVAARPMEEFHALFNTGQVDASAEDVAIVEKHYARIKDCDLQTFPYKF